jgi:transcriptional regulator with XRE-family HTH domain
MATEVMRKPAPAVPLRELRAALGLSRERMARLLDVSAKTIERWECSGKPPSQQTPLRRLAQLEQIVELGRMVYQPNGLPLLMKTPLPIFEGRTPQQLIEADEGYRVVGLLATEYEGAIT